MSEEHIPILGDWSNMCTYSMAHTPWLKNGVAQILEISEIQRRRCMLCTFPSGGLSELAITMNRHYVSRLYVVIKYFTTQNTGRLIGAILWTIAMLYDTGSLCPIVRDTDRHIDQRTDVLTVVG